MHPKHGYPICADCYRSDGVARHVSPMVAKHSVLRVRIGNPVTTKHGKGVVVTREPIRDSCRWGVALKENPFSYSPVYYWLDELVDADSDIANG